MRTQVNKILLVMLVCAISLSCRNQEKELGQALAQHAFTENERYPMKVDELTILDSCVFIKPNILEYQYTLTVAPIARLDTNTMKSALRQNLIHLIRTELNSKYFRDNGVTFQYLYKSENEGVKNTLFTLTIPKEEYKLNKDDTRKY